ncbi:MAG: hypothetical protein J5742_01260 [Alphaproteobacteria bacterium]|nr:hypothetical protein [Alphaproteobacteria bacterium]
MRFFNFKRKTEKSSAVVSDPIRIIAENVFTHDGCDEFEYEFLKHVFQNKRVLASYDNKVAWLVCITALALHDDIAAARSLFLMYYKRFGMNGVESYEPICRIAKSLGLGNDLTNKTIAVYDKVKKIRSKKRFENIIKKAKSVAIVGRSPALIGKKLGHEIVMHMMSLFGLIWRMFPANIRLILA